MRKNSIIDDLFKEGLNDLNFPGKDAAWKKLEQELNERKKKRKAVVLIFSICSLSGALFFATKDFRTNTNKIVVSKSLQQQQKTNKGLEQAGPAFINDNTASGLQGTVHANSQEKNTYSVPKKVRIFSNTVTEDEAAATRKDATHIFITENIRVDPAIAISKAPLKFTDIGESKPAPSIKRPVIQNQKPKLVNFSVSVVAGSDIFNLNKKVGYYAGAELGRHLDKYTSVSAGVNYSFNALNEEYRLSNKPSQQRETDAQINSLTMLRFPILFQQQLSKTKLALEAGLIPSYILNASVYNMPNSASGDPSQYRLFTIHDVHRFNILFNAGIKYYASEDLSFVLSGSYGFTGLVKNAYINQSNVNDNFKTIQAGIVLKLK